VAQHDVPMCLITALGHGPPPFADKRSGELRRSSWCRASMT
jgi:hypothetical protein